MIHLPLSLYSSSASPTARIVVGPDCDGGRVSFSVDLQRGDVGPFRRRIDEETLEAIRFFEDRPRDLDVFRHGYGLAAIVQRLHDDLRDIYEGDDHQVERDLKPAEARALAAMLVHFAVETFVATIEQLVQPDGRPT